ncbi:MAG: hypothetical protein RJA31_535 [Actinomycetota bacterium]|jgi:hypothetical protein
MTDIQISAAILAGIAVLVSVFQIALAAGAPWGEWAFGGQNKGTLPRNLRASSAISLVVYGVQIAHFGSRAGWWAPPFGESVGSVLDWVFVAFFALGTVMNGISRSAKERYTWTPVVLVSLVCALWVVL